MGKSSRNIESPEVSETETITYERRKKHRPDDCVTDQGLRFTEGVPVELIHIPAPEMQGKVGYRSSQAQPDLDHCRSPSFDRSFADVSFIAGMLVEKYRYHLPFYCQHQKLEANGITVIVAR